MQPWFYMLGAQKNRLIVDSTFSTHNICLVENIVYIHVS